MNPATITQMHSRADRARDGAIARDGNPTTCAKGCFFCCRESVDATAAEVAGIVEGLTPDQREHVTKKSHDWLARFEASGIGKEYQPHHSRYRPLNLWCPLLADDGTCSAYERRPLSCRLHVTMGPPEGCRDDDKRSQQKYALFPGLLETLMAAQLCELEEGESDVADHLGILLARELLGEDRPSAQRTTMTRKGYEIWIQRNEL